MCLSNVGEFDTVDVGGHPLEASSMQVYITITQYIL